jgi:hypothetical protein
MFINPLEVKIEPEEVSYLVKEMARLREQGEEPDWYSAVFLLFERYKGRDDASTKTLCIMERVQCMLQLLSDPRMRGWTIETIRPGCLLTNEAVFKATSLCTMKQPAENGRFIFDADEFFDIVLKESEVEGKA